jgi:predicted lipoprotein with Yx(FWY)xxD motif
MPVPVRVGAGLGVTMAAALLAAACSSSSSSGSPASGSPAAGGGSSSASGATVITTASAGGGMVLTDGSGHAVYMWTKDTSGQSACSGTCASTWPPVAAHGTVTASGGAKASDLGMITRSDGAKQVTYDGHPLYYYSGDSGMGQANGQGSDSFGAKWWLVAPSGASVTAAVSGFTPGAPATSPATPPASPSTSHTSGGGTWA